MIKTDILHRFCTRIRNSAALAHLLQGSGLEDASGKTVLLRVRTSASAQGLFAVCHGFSVILNIA